MVLGMDETLDRDRFGADLASQWAGANRGLLGIDAQSNQSQGGGGWTDWARMGLGAASMFSGGGGGMALVRIRIIDMILMTQVPFGIAVIRT
jgi:hypothetical protein